MQFKTETNQKNIARLLATHALLEHGALLRAASTEDVQVLITDVETGKTSWVAYGARLPESAVQLRTKDIEPGTIIIVGDEMLYVHNVADGRIIASPDRSEDTTKMRVINRDVVKTWFDICTASAGELFAMTVGSISDKNKSNAMDYISQAISNAVGQAVKSDKDLQSAMRYAGIAGFKLELLSTKEASQIQSQLVSESLDSLDDDKDVCDCPNCVARRSAS